jgi:hypothetical protein
MGNLTKFVIATGIVVTAVIIVLVAVSTIHSTGTIKSLNCECSVSSIDWGELYGGYGANYTVSVRVTGSPANLTLSTSNWNPSIAADYIHLTWDYVEGTVLEVGVWTDITLTLTVDPTITGVDSFSHDIHIEARG